ncbi:MAG: beta-ketoacyl-[acyl-carrier-protein] synthase family protein [Planctomycetota bacterium]|jgi:3-oxoacyl-[acyl-carrier-protein] synthase II
MKRRVVVTGLGVISPNGIGTEAFWSATLAGKSGIAPIEAFDTEGFEVRSAGEVRDFRAQDYVKNRKSLKIMGRNIRFGVAAARLAVESSGIDETQPDPTRFGVVMGSGIVPTDVVEVGQAVIESLDEERRFDLKRFGASGQKLLHPLWLLKHLPNMVAAHISIQHGAQGPNNTIVTACSASTQAIGEAARIIERGDADVMIAGGSDSRIDPLSLVAYTLLGAVTTADRPPEELSRPFDRHRDGFVLGEGGACLILEEESRAKARGATILAEIAGYGSSFDAEGVTRPSMEGVHAARSMTNALKDAGVAADELDYVSAHGTSTVLNDLMETAAVKLALGDHARKVPLSSIKSMIGHLIGAAGAMEAAVSVLAIRDGAIPPTINLHTPDPECDLDYVPNEAREKKIKKVLTSNFGFGGQNAALVFQEYDG